MDGQAATGFEKTRGPKKSRDFFSNTWLAQFRPWRTRPLLRPFSLRDVGRIHGGGRVAPGTRPESIMFFSRWTRINEGRGESNVNSNEEQKGEGGGQASIQIACYRNDASKCCVQVYTRLMSEGKGRAPNRRMQITGRPPGHTRIINGSNTADRYPDTAAAHVFSKPTLIRYPNFPANFRTCFFRPPRFYRRDGNGWKGLFSRRACFQIVASRPFLYSLSHLFCLFLIQAGRKKEVDLLLLFLRVRKKNFHRMFHLLI